MADLTPEELAALLAQRRQERAATAAVMSDPEAPTRGQAETAGALKAQGEQRFQNWYAGVADKLNAKERRIDPNPDAKEHYYDYRAFHRDMEAGKDIRPPTEPGGHWPSEYKTPDHPRTFLADPTTGKVFNTHTTEYVAGGQVPQRALVASERSPDMPGFDPERAKQALLIAQAMRARGYR